MSNFENDMKAMLWALCRYEQMYREFNEEYVRQYEASAHRDDRLSPTTKLVLSHLLREYLKGPDRYADFLTDILLCSHIYADKDTLAISVMLGLSQAQVRLAFQELEQAGWIKKGESEVDLPMFEGFRTDGYRFDWVYERPSDDIDMGPREEVRFN